MEKIKILLLAANPWDTDRISPEEEYRKIERMLQESGQQAKFELKYTPAANSDDLQHQLLSFKPHIVHFSGHGENDGLRFQAADGKTQFVSAQALAELFALCTKNIRCVLLNACHSAPLAEAIVLHIPHVIGMNQAIGDEAAVAFAGGFYRALFNAEPIESAFKFGVNALSLANMPGADIPELKSRITQYPTGLPFLTHLPADIVLHATPAQRAWAQNFANELRKHLSQQLGQSCAIALATEQAIAAGAHLLLVNDEEAQFPPLPNDAKRWLITRSSHIPPALAGISHYTFHQASVTDYQHAATFQELARVLAKHLQSLQRSEQTRKAEKPLGEPLVFVHTEPDETQSFYAKGLKSHFKSRGLAFATANLKDYREDVRSYQKNCQAVLIVYGGNDRWAKDRLLEYVNLQKKRKEPLKVVAIHADGSHNLDDLEDLNIYDIPLYPCPPKPLDEMVQRFVEGLK